MGKITEALKKASKENRLRSVDRKEKRPTLEKANDAPKDKPIDKKLPGQSSRALSEAEKEPKKGNIPVAAKRSALDEKTVPIVQADSPSMPDGNAVDPVIKSQEAPISDDSARKTPTNDDTNIVMVRTPQAEKAISSIPSIKTPVHEEDKEPVTLKSVKATPEREIRISYSKTKVQVMDPETMKNNKIFSMFDDIETTDQIKILRTQVLKRLKAIGGNSILVTSANPYEGKTFTSINLGVSIAKEFNRTVLIIDADLRKPTRRHTSFSTEFFSIDVEVGLTDYLKGEAEIPEILINPGINKLTLIPSGKPVFNAPELLNASRMEEMMAEIKSRYPSDRLVIVDGPAMLPFPDATILSRYVDGVLPVVEIEKTSTEDMKKMMDSLKSVHVLGTVLNKKKG